MLTKGNKDLPIDKVTAENYLVPKGTEKRYHVKMEIPRFDPATGAKLSKANIRQFGINTYRNLASAMAKQGYKMEVLFDPIEEQKDEKTEQRASPPRRGKTEKTQETQAPATEQDSVTEQEETEKGVSE